MAAQTQTMRPGFGRMELILHNPPPSSGSVEKFTDINRETVVLRPGKHTRDDLVTGQRAVAERQYGCGAFVELHSPRGSGQEVAVARRVLLQLTPRSKPNAACSGQRFVLH